MYKSTKQHVSLSKRVNALKVGLDKIENHRWLSLSLNLVSFASKYVSSFFWSSPATGNRRSIKQSPRSTANHFSLMKKYFSLVCKSCTIMCFKYHDVMLPLPELSCHTRQKLISPKGLNNLNIINKMF